MAKIDSKIYKALLDKEMLQKQLMTSTIAVDPASGPDMSVVTLQHMRDAYAKLKAIDPYPYYIAPTIRKTSYKNGMVIIDDIPAWN